MLQQLVLTDFKAFHSETIPLKPLTVLVGENNSGKSSLIAAIRLLAQTVQSPDLSVPLLFDGAFGDFGAYRDVVHGNHRGRPMQLGLSVPPMRGTANRDTAQPYTFLSEFKYRTQRRETVLRSTKLTRGTTHIATVGRPADGSRETITGVRASVVPAAARGQLHDLLRMVNFLPTLRPLELSKPGSRSADVTNVIDKIRLVERDWRRAHSAFLTALRAVEVIGAMRQPPNRTYLHSGSVSRRIGVAGENWGGLIALAVSGRGRDPLLELVTNWIKNAGIASSIEVAWLSDRHFEVMVQHPVTHERENISDVGRGTSQVLPVIVGGYRLKADDTYLVEEPEIHLHPRAQAALGDYFLDLTNRGVQSIVETHSEYLVTRLQQHVASGQLSPDNVIFYYVGSAEDGKSLRPLRLNSDAVFDNSMPGGFFPQRLEEATKLARSRKVSGRT